MVSSPALPSNVTSAVFTPGRVSDQEEIVAVASVDVVIASITNVVEGVVVAHDNVSAVTEEDSIVAGSAEDRADERSAVSKEGVVPGAADEQVVAISVTSTNIERWSPVASSFPGPPMITSFPAGWSNGKGRRRHLRRCGRCLRRHPDGRPRVRRG